MLRENGLQEIKFPENLPSGDILQFTKMMPQTTHTADTSPEERMEEEMTVHDPPVKRRSLEKNGSQDCNIFGIGKESDAEKQRGIR